MNELQSTASVAASTLAVLLSGHVATAQSDEPTPKIQVTGRAVLFVQPERAPIDVGVVRILSLSEGAPEITRPIPMFRAKMAQAAAAPTPVEPGTIEVTASVILLVEISQ